MALLAETKRKVKYGLDPRNTNWSNDDSKFGQRLMEKMGWEKGKGLGAKESGMTEHIKTDYKSDTRGLGCSPKDADAWIAHQDDFNDLLKALNSEHGGEDSQGKDENKSTTSDGHKRYYGRFARGRVQKLRSTEDLDCIFGKRKAESAPASPANRSASASDEESTKPEPSLGLKAVVSASSVQEYFAQKMAQLKARSTSNLATESDSLSAPDGRGDQCSENQERIPPVFGAVGFSYDNEDTSKEKGDEAGPIDVTFSIGDEGDMSSSGKKKKSKKRKSKEIDREENSGETKSKNLENNSDMESKQNEETLEVEKKKKSKKKKKKLDEEKESSDKNDNEDALHEDISVEAKQKKRKKQLTTDKDNVKSDNDDGDVEKPKKKKILTTNEDNTITLEEVKSSKSKKKKKQKQDSDSPPVNIDTEEKSADNSKAKAKRKKLEESSCDTAEMDNETDTKEETVRKKKKKSKKSNKSDSNNNEEEESVPEPSIEKSTETSSVASSKLPDSQLSEGKDTDEMENDSIKQKSNKKKGKKRKLEQVESVSENVEAESKALEKTVDGAPKSKKKRVTFNIPDDDSADSAHKREATDKTGNTGKGVENEEKTCQKDERKNVKVQKEESSPKTKSKAALNKKKRNKRKDKKAILRNKFGSMDKAFKGSNFASIPGYAMKSP